MRGLLQYRVRQVAVPLSMWLVSLLAHGAPQVTAKVLNFGTYENGNFYVSFDTSINEPGCAGPYLELPAGHAAIKSVSASVMLAMVTNASVVLVTNGCLGAHPTFVGTSRAALQVNKP
ncbi:MAG: hypothetical protein JNM97_23385 [Rhodoferax sp.]|nr:hypothetical protein [Rhodoferax sp.]